MKAKVIGYCLFLFAAVCQILATILPYWKVNDPSGQVIELQEIFSGLWHKCIGFSSGNWQCDDFDSIWLGQQAEITTARACMLVNCFLNMVTFILFQVAAPWTFCFELDQKVKLMRVAGALIFLANVVCIAGSGYYGSRVLNDYYTSTQVFGGAIGGSAFNVGSGSSMVMKFGGGLYTAWISTFFGFASSIMILCCGHFGDEDYYDDDEYEMGGTQINPMKPNLPYRQDVMPNPHAMHPSAPQMHQTPNANQYI